MPSSPLSGQAQTVLGPIAGEAMGITLPHEHLLIDFEVMFREPATAAERTAVLAADLHQARYRTAQDPRSAHEVLLERVAQRQQEAQAAELEQREARSTRRGTGGTRESAGEAFLKSLARAAGSNLGRKLFRGVLGTLLK